jgi:hypothetical protein
MILCVCRRVVPISSVRSRFFDVIASILVLRIGGVPRIAIGVGDGQLRALAVRVVLVGVYKSMCALRIVGTWSIIIFFIPYPVSGD